MNTEISKILARGESKTVEFKESFHDDALETIGAFANAQGGVLLLGVQDSGKVVGCQIGKKTTEDWSNRIQEATEPKIQPSIMSYEREEKPVIAIRVSKVVDGPVSIRGRYFKRTGKTNQRMSHEEIMQRMQAFGRSSWDSAIEDDATLNDLDQSKIAQFIKMVRENGQRPLPKDARAQDVLNNFRLLHNEKPTRAAILLFGKDPRKFNPGALIKIGRFRSETLIIDNRQLEGTVFEQLDRALEWFREHLKTAFVITGKLQRDTVWEYPLDAIREGIVNAICHRDYADTSFTQIRLYDDRLEIWNPGGLVPGLCLDDLLKFHRSMPRNSLIAEAFFYSGLIENWGTGTIRMASLLRSADIQEPVFETPNSSSFRLSFIREEFSEKQLRQLGLNERQMQAVAICKRSYKMTNLKYKTELSVSKRTASDELAELVALKVFIKHGKTGPGTFYSLRVKGRKG